VLPACESDFNKADCNYSRTWRGCNLTLRQLFRKHRSSVWQHPVDILVRVNDKHGNLAFEKSLYIVDTWGQAGEYCSEVAFDGTKIILGPGSMYADGPGAYVIDTLNLKGVWLYETQSNNSLNRTRR
jgi:hypothetical protein